MRDEGILFGMAGTDLTNQEKLEEVYKLTLENNHMLHSMRNRERVANAFRILYWLIIIGSIFGAYYYVRPILDVFTTNKGKIDDTLNQFQSIMNQLPNMDKLRQIQDQLKAGDATNVQP